MLRNRMIIDVKTSVHRAATSGQKVINVVKNLSVIKTQNKEIGAIVPVDNSEQLQTAVSITDRTPEEVYQIKNKIYEKMKRIKNDYLNKLGQKYCKTIDPNKGAWESLKENLNKQGVLVSNLTLRVKVVMQHVVPKQEDYYGYRMDRYNERAAYYSSNIQVAEFNIPLLDSSTVVQANNIVLRTLGDILDLDIKPGDKRESIRDYTQNEFQKYGKEYLDRVRQLRQERLKSKEEVLDAQTIEYSSDEEELLDDNHNHTSAKWTP